MALVMMATSACSSEDSSGGPPPTEPLQVDGPAEVVATIAVPDGPSRIATTSDGVWVISDDAGANALRVIDPATDDVESTVDVGNFALHVDATDDDVWVTVAGGNVVRVDAATREVVETIPVDGFPALVAVAPDAVWVLDGDDPVVTRIDPATNAVVATIDARRDTCGDNGVCESSAITATGDSIWVGMNDDDLGTSTIATIDAATDEVVDAIEFDGYAGRMAAVADVLWVGDPANDFVSRIDTKSNEVVETFNLAPQDLAANARSLWLTTQQDFAVEIDAATNEITNTVDVGFASRELAVDGAAVWVCVAGDNSVVRIDPGPT